MTTLVIVGAQWGDEGKGKIVDRLAASATHVVRYGGGANAGHTLVVEGDKVVFHLVPSGALRPEVQCLLGPGMVLDLEVLADELSALGQRGLLSPPSRLAISERAHVVLAQHKLVDGLRERGPNAIGTTKRGIGPCYEDRAGRVGLRIGDLRDPARARAKIATSIERWRPTIEALGGETPSAEAIAQEAMRHAETLLAHVGDISDPLHAAREAGAAILLEGAQGTMLDIDHGTYPFVTSSSVTSGGAATGSGLGPTHIDRVLGIAKAYTTRVGDGPFPTELLGEDGEALRAAGHEFGATTGRPRRCGWLDVPVLRHAVRVNGIGELAVTKLDVLAGMERVPICVAYERDGERFETPPVELDGVTPVLEELPGWGEEIRAARTLEALPKTARAYLDRMQELAGVPVAIASVGPDREETIELLDSWR